MSFNISRFIVMIVPLIFAVTIHEFAHGFAAYKFGDDTARQAGRLTLNPIRHLDFFGSFLLPLLLRLSGSPVLFGYAKPVPINPLRFHDYRKGMIIVSSAGVFANFTCAVVSGILFQGFILLLKAGFGRTTIPVLEPLLFMLQYSVIINLVLAVFNLIPIPPLDGSKILAMLLPEHLSIQYQRIERYGMLIIFLLLMTKTLGKIINFFLIPMADFLLGG